ncbi:MAG: RNA polymerase sigma factor [Vicinamibacteria bacterium]
MRAGPAVEESVERDWVDRFLTKRDEAAFRAIYRAHTGYLFGLAVRLCGGRHDIAQDAVQDAWLRAALALPGFRWGSRLRTWLGGIVVNCCREQRRRAEREPPVVEDAGQSMEPLRLDLEAAVRALPDGLREVLVLHAIEGYTHEEIGGLLGIAAGTSKSRLFDARVALRRRLAREGGGSR